jgi:hypothetical protein
MAKFPQTKWVNSDWDTYWGSCDTNLKSDQAFYILPYGLIITYKELTTEIDVILAEIQDLTGKSDASMATLRSFMETFISTVDNSTAIYGLLNGGGSNILPNS